MNKEKILEGLKSIDNIKDINDISKACFNKIVEIVDNSGKSTEQKINDLMPYATEVHSFLVDGDVWNDITDYIDGTPQRGELITYDDLADWVESADEHEEWLETIYADVKEGFMGFTWDW